MLFKTTHGQSFELRILGYEYPQCETEEYDSNWLRVEGKVADPRGGWEFRHPCLLTYEVSHLADWLESLARGAASPKELTFIEPNISFRWIEATGGASLCVYFELEARPPWAPFDAVEDEHYWLVFPASDLDLYAAAVALRDELRLYPQRAAL